METFKISERIKEAWVLYKNNIPMFFLFMACAFFIKILGTKGGQFLSVIAFIAGIYLFYIITVFLLSLVDKKEINLFSKSLLLSPSFLSFSLVFILLNLIGLILSTLIVIVAFSYSAFSLYFSFGLMLAMIIVLVCVETYLMIKISFSLFIPIEHKLNAFKSIKKSWKITKKNFWPALGNFILIGIISFSGIIIALVIGALARLSFNVIFTLIVILSFISLPIGMVLFTLMYKSLSNNHKNVTDTLDGEKKIEAEKIADINEENTDNKSDRVIKEAEIIKE